MRINLVKYGPLAVSYEFFRDFHTYKSGIYHHTGSGEEQDGKFKPIMNLSHAVLLIGYGTDNSNPEKPQDYWILKNSWGKEWGENGYFRMRRGVNECGIETMAMQSFPVM